MTEPRHLSSDGFRVTSITVAKKAQVQAPPEPPERVRVALRADWLVLTGPGGAHTVYQFDEPGLSATHGYKRRKEILP